MGDESGGQQDDRMANGGMTPEGVGNPRSAREFERELTTLVTQAAMNEVDVVGGWSVERGDGSEYLLGVEIFPVRRE